MYRLTVMVYRNQLARHWDNTGPGSTVMFAGVKVQVSVLYNIMIDKTCL